MCNITEEKHADAIRQSESSVKIFHKREPCDEFVNDYNLTIMKSWEANMDLQYVTDVYAWIKYILSYVTKDEKQLSDLLRNASKEAKGLTLRQLLKNLGNVFFTKERFLRRKLSIEFFQYHKKEQVEVLYLCQQTWMKIVFKFSNLHIL